MVGNVGGVAGDHHGWLVAVVFFGGGGGGLTWPELLCQELNSWQACMERVKVLVLFTGG